MSTVEVFDPPMCCSTGVCGPSVDPALATFASDLSWLADRGASVERHNLSQEPKAFAESDLVRRLLAERGEEALPAVVVDGELRSSGRFPTRGELAGWSLTGTTPAAPTFLDAGTTELVALAAAVGANCESCFKFHDNEARKLGVGSEVMAQAVRVAQAVKEAPARSMLDLAAKLLDTSVESLHRSDPVAVAVAAETADVGCCGGTDAASGADPTTEASAASGCCGGTEAATEAPVTATASGTSGCC